jgi:hypothetical protein
MIELLRVWKRLLVIRESLLLQLHKSECGSI